MCVLLVKLHRVVLDVDKIIPRFSPLACEPALMIASAEHIHVGFVMALACLKHLPRGKVSGAMLDPRGSDVHADAPTKE